MGGGGGRSPIKGEGLFFHEPFAAFLPLDTAAGRHAIHARPTCIWNGWARRNSRFQMVVRFSSRLRCTLFLTCYMTCLLDNILAPSLPTPIFVGQSRLPPPPPPPFPIRSGFEIESASFLPPLLPFGKRQERGVTEGGGLGTDRT